MHISERNVKMKSVETKEEVEAKNACSGVLTSTLNGWKRKSTIKRRAKGANFKLPH